MTTTDLLMGILLPLLLVASGFFSGSETALFSLSAHERLRLEQSGTVPGRAVRTLLAETRSLLITLLLGNMTINVLYFVVSTVLLLSLQRREIAGPVISTGVSLGTLLLLILFGEIAPKLAATRVTALWTRIVSLPLLGIHRAIAPLRTGLNLTVITPLARLIAPRESPEALSSEELEALMQLSQERGVIDTEEEKQLQEALALGQLKVRQLMTPRVDIDGLDASDPPGELIRRLRETRHSRLPVYHRDLDNVLGVLVAREVLLHRPRTRHALKRMIRRVQFVPELQRADHLLVVFRKTGTTMAVVVDEYGGTAGLVTLEDIVQRLTGEIAGGPEEGGEPAVQPLEDGVWRVSAGLPLRDWIAAFRPEGVTPRSPEAGMRTLGGLVMARLGRLPAEGDRIAIGNILLEVESMSHRRVRWLRVRLLPSEAQAKEPPR